MPAMVIGMSRSRGSATVPTAEHRAGLAPLPVALERVAGDRGGEEHQVIEGGDGPPRTQPRIG